jgi:hypothetical protein|uniref:Major capsid protein 1/2 C-terminal domain-containing protein n=1 Tax=Candidatus Aramenus sulfurataquae TaxID=1326980 RepID=A0AAE3FMJ1_9CREN|nr:hypothetical protein [Candidatus Aramenus sulfurataquae]
MTASRALSQSSLPRYLAKMLRRYSAISAGAVNEETKTPSQPAVSTAYVTAYSVASNWVNGFVPYSQLRYKVLPILEKYGIPRSMSYGFMAMVQHAYKQLVLKKDTSVDEVVKRFYVQIFGSTPDQQGWLNISDDKKDALVRELLALIGVNVEVLTNA